MRGYCERHVGPYDKAAAKQGGARVFRLTDYERDPDTGYLRRVG